MSPITSPAKITDAAKSTGARRPEFWRSIAHLAGSDEVQQYLTNEFPGLAEAGELGSRRDFLRLLGATMALAGITSTGCRRWPVEEVRPHSARPEGIMPGVAEHYATMIELDGVATGLLAKSYDGRPIKIEGNPDHVFSCGAASALAQASVLELYDPDRSRRVLHRVGSERTPSSWSKFQVFAAPHFQSLRARQGVGLAFLIQSTSSPTWRRLQQELTQSFPQARWFEYQPLHRENEFAGSRAAFGRALRCQYDLEQAKTILCFDADLLGSHPAHLKLARDWASGRSSVDHGEMSRVYVFESGISLTGSVADVRLPCKPSAVETGIAYVAYRFGILKNKPPGLSKQQTGILEQAAGELKLAGAAGLVVAGPAQPARVHQLAHAINGRLSNSGGCVSYTIEPLARATSCIEQIRELSDLLQGNVINTLVMVGGNPVFDGPADTPLDLRSDELRPLTSIHLSLHDNETSEACTWHLPAPHFLECWGDGRAWDGTYTLQQPLILPLFEGKSPIELLAILSGRSPANGLPLVRATFDREFTGASQADWEQALHDGLKRDSEYPVITPPTAEVDPGQVASVLDTPWEFRFVGDAKTLDGRFANNAWLQELPEPLTKLTWGNAALISPADAQRLSLEQGDVVRIQTWEPQIAVEVPVFVLPGHAAGCVTLPLGYGRTRSGRIGDGIGVNVYPLRDSASSYVVATGELSKTGGRQSLVTTQVHDLLDPVAESAKLRRLGGRGQPGMLIHETLLAAFQADPAAVHGHAHAVHPAPLFDLPDPFDSPHKWGMSIDLNACIGCSGCVLACQAENNIPVVGKDNVAVNREMHWLRIDRYFKGDVDQPDVVHLPLACAHCQNAPCEQVCPVAATVHDSEGLNSMVYNRCIGTRYCANNCPYKVRRFNYFDYQASDPRSPAKPWVGMPDQQQSEDVSTLKKMVHNPQVTVRMRGVMEKCTYCVQRLVEARIHAKNEHAQGLRESQLVSDGEVKTACQATCPTGAIVFGDLNDTESAVAKARRSIRSYEMLEELNLGARTTYLAKIRNRDAATEDVS